MVVTTVTRRSAVAVTPPVSADTTVAPSATAVARPVASTVAMPASSVAHANVASAITTPSPSRAVAVNWCDAFSAGMVALAGATSTNRPPRATVSVAVPTTPLAVAVMVATPVATATA
jgi:hypothetical protein